MNIKTLLKIIALMVLAFLVVFSVLIYLSFQNYRVAIEKSKVANSIVFNVFERKLLGDDYLNNPGERARKQWFSKQEGIKKTIAVSEAAFNTQEEIELLTSLKAGLTGSENTFTEAVTIYDPIPNASPSSRVDERKIRIRNLLGFRAQETISAATVLAENNDEAAEQNLQQIMYLLSIAGVLFSILLATSFWFTWRNATSLEQESAKDQAILASVGDGLVVVDSQGKVTLLNAAVEQMLGWTRSELLGKSWAEKVPMEDEKGNRLPTHNRPLYVALREGRTIVASKSFFIKKDSQKVPIAITVSPITFAGKSVGAIGVFRDITREVQVDKMKSEFISLASHQLRTPLTAMKWNLELLLTEDIGPLSPEQKEMIQGVDNSNERMIQLVNSLLNVSRIESGRIIIDPVPTDVAQLIKEVQSDLKAKLEEKRQQFSVNVSADLPKVTLDPKLVRQVYLNLLTNAIKYTPQAGKISVTISQKDGQMISQITDTGYGIPAKDHDKVFQKFYRGQNIVKFDTDGNGLGMYLVKSIIESSKGKIWFESEEGKGSTFWFTIPLAGMEAKKGEVTLGA